jgi:hypothetical protein
MRVRKKATLFLVLVLTLAITVPVVAQDSGQDPPPPCEGEGVSGQVVAVDENTVTIDTVDNGRCTVTLDGEYDHPIVSLLGAYFGDVSAEALAEALEATQGCVAYDEAEGVWTWADCDSDGAVKVKVTGVAEGDECTFTLDGPEGPETVTVDDPEACEALSESLQALGVDWALDETGALIQPGDEIAAYHEEGMGFGVLVKLYAIAAESEEACEGADDDLCAVTVEELVAAFQSGTGMGQLFKDYFKPSMRGVGHVRHADRERPDHPEKPEHAGPKPKDEDGKPEHAGPKPKDEDGKPEHAGPKPKDEDGKPEQAGPEPKDENKPGKPEQAGPKPKKNKKG